MLSTFSWFQISAYVMILITLSWRVHVSFYFFFLCKRATPWYNDVNINIYLLKNRQFYVEKAINSIFFIFAYFYSNSFFMFVRKKAKNFIVTNLNLLLKNILLFCKKKKMCLILTQSIEKSYFHWENKSIEKKIITDTINWEKLFPPGRIKWKKYWEKINIYTINLEKLFDRSAEHK